MSAPPVQSFVSTPDGVQLAVHAYGGDGPPILLAHPTGFNGRMWDPVAHRLVAAGRSVWSLDFRGHGMSDAVTDFEWSLYATDVLTVIDEYELDADTLVCAGLSMGGTALLLAAHRRPTVARAFWCYEPIVFSPEVSLPAGVEVPLATITRKRRAVWPSKEDALASYSTRPPMQTFDPEALAGYVDDAFRERPDGAWELTCAPADEAHVYNHGMINGAWELLPEVTVPTTLVVGERTDAIGPARGQRIAARLGRGRFVQWDGATHFGPVEDPDRATREILAR